MYVNLLNGRWDLREYRVWTSLLDVDKEFCWIPIAVAEPVRKIKELQRT